MSKSKSKKRSRVSHWETQTQGARLRSQKQENRLSKQLGAALTPNSGATPDAKSDAVGPDDRPGPNFRYEMKTTKAKKMPVGIAELAKIWKEAIATGRRPVMSVTMEAMDSGPAPKDWVVMELSVFQELTGEGED